MLTSTPFAMRAALADGAAAEVAYQHGLRVFAGHVDYQNTAPIAALDTIEELSIGHAIIAMAVFTGLDQAVKEMLAIINRAVFFQFSNDKGTLLQTHSLGQEMINYGTRPPIYRNVIIRSKKAVGVSF